MDDIKKLLFTIPKDAMQEKLEEYKARVSAALPTQFDCRLPREDAIERYMKRNMSTELYLQDWSVIECC